MSRSWKGYFAGAAFALCATASGAAYAQNSASAGGSAAEAQLDADQDARDDVRIERHFEHLDGGIERHIERRMIIREALDSGHHMDPANHLRTMLQLKPGQEPALTAYLAAVKPMHHPEHIVQMSDRHGAQDGAKTTTQRLAEMEAQMAEQAAQGHVRIEATRKFYSQLEPSQKKVFDQMPMVMIGPMGPMMPMGGNMKVMMNMDGTPSMPAIPHHPPMPRTPPVPAAPHS